MSSIHPAQLGIKKEKKRKLSTIEREDSKEKRPKPEKKGVRKIMYKVYPPRSPVTPPDRKMTLIPQI